MQSEPSEGNLFSVLRFEASHPSQSLYQEGEGGDDDGKGAGRTQN